MNSTAAQRAVIHEFMDEFYEAYETSERDLVALELEPQNRELLNNLFRQTHNIKGNLTIVGAGKLIPLLQALEDVLSALREHFIIFDTGLSDVVLLTLDRIKLLLEEFAERGSLSPESLKMASQLSHRLTDLSVQNGDKRETRINQMIAELDPSTRISVGGQEDKDSETKSPSPPKNRLENNTGDIEALLVQHGITLDEDMQLFVGLSAPLEQRSPYWRGRAERQLAIGLAMNKAAGAPIQPEQLAAAILTHDMGMAFLPMALLHKSSRLSPRETRLMEQHTGTVAELLQKMANWNEAAQMVAQHHERHDGSGYPAGLEDADMAEGAKIIAILDTFDAILHQRAHSDQLKRPFARAVLEVNRQSGQLFSESWTEHFNYVVRQQLES